MRGSLYTDHKRIIYTFNKVQVCPKIDQHMFLTNTPIGFLDSMWNVPFGNLVGFYLRFNWYYTNFNKPIDNQNKFLKMCYVLMQGSQPVARGPKVARQVSKSGPQPLKEWKKYKWKIVKIEFYRIYVYWNNCNYLLF